MNEYGATRISGCESLDNLRGSGHYSYALQAIGRRSYLRTACGREHQV